MKKYLSFYIVSLLFYMHSLVGLQPAVCIPDPSFDYQKSKKISPQAQDLLARIIEDKFVAHWPVSVCQCWLSSLFGPRGGGFHNGLDFAALQGTPVYATADGYVEKIEYNNDPQSYGNMILLHHGKSGYKSRYAHLHTIEVQEGDFVKKNMQIGTVGATGHVVSKRKKGDPSHLHFEIYIHGTRINPLIALLVSDKEWVNKNKRH